MPAAEIRRSGRVNPAARLALQGVLALALLSAAAPAEDTASGISGAPVSARPFPRGKTLFVPLPAEQTGVKADNPYNDPRMWGDLYQEFEGGSIGTGVAIGDYDGDGRPD